MDSYRYKHHDSYPFKGENTLLKPPSRSRMQSNGDPSHGEGNILHQASNISVVVATETVNFILMDIVQVIIIGFMKMILDFLIKPVFSIAHNGILWPIMMAVSTAYKVKNSISLRMTEILRCLLRRGRPPTPMDACNV